MKQFFVKNELTRESLAKHERRMNNLMIPFCAGFAAISLFYVIRFFLVGLYAPEDGRYYYQIYFEVLSIVLLVACAILAQMMKKTHPMVPRYFFAVVYLIKAVTGSLFFEFDYLIFYIIPIVYAIGYYDVLYSTITSVGITISYLVAELLAGTYGIVNVSYYDVSFVNGLSYLFDDTYYQINRLWMKVIPNAIVLLCVGILCVAVAKIGAELLLRERKSNHEKASLDRELSLGKEIQQSMLPDRILQTPYCSVFSYMVSAKNVGGDFYDYFQIGENKVLITIGDVSGKGVSASLFASNAKALIRAFAMSGYEVYEILQKTNDSLCSTNKKKLFVTIWLGILDLTTGDCAYCNAGHNPPILKKKNGEVCLIDCKPNFIIGRRMHMSYAQHHMTLDVGDTILLYTDGVTEAMDKNGGFYGEERLMEFTRNNAIDDRFTKDLRKDIFGFKGDAEQSDDISMACLMFTKQKTDTIIKRSFKAAKDEYRNLHSFVMSFAAQYTAEKNTLNDIEMSLGEIFSNIDFYSAKSENELTDVEVELSYENGTLSIIFSDNGIPFNPLHCEKPSLEENRKNKIVGGFGIFIVTKLMDDVSYQYDNNQNILTLKKKLKEAIK